MHEGHHIIMYNSFTFTGWLVARCVSLGVLVGRYVVINWPSS